MRYVRRGKGRVVDAVIDITSLIDAAFILIIFLLVSTSFKKKDHAFTLALPTSSQQEVIVELDQHVVHISQSGDIFLNSPTPDLIEGVSAPLPLSDPLDIEGLEERVRELVKDNEGLSIRFVVDQNVPYQILISAIGAIHAGGAQNIQLQYDLPDSPNQ